MLKASLCVCQVHNFVGFFLCCGLCFQLGSLQEVIQEKEALLEEHVHQHQAELLKMVVQSDMEVEMQQVYLIQ